jgi:UDP-N-acetylmuramate--alanine ligase
MSIYNIVASTDEATVVAEYAAECNVRPEKYQSEAELEREFIRQLTSQGYEYISVHNEAALIENLRKQLELLNDFTFTDSEWDRFFTECIANTNEGIVEKTRKIQDDHIQILKREDGTTKNIYLLDKKNIHNNRLQVINQYEEAGGNAKLGCGKVAVAEADESDGSLINLNPVIAVITNIEADHLDYYKGIDDIVGTFQRFISRLPENGNAIICIDDRNAASLMKEDDSRFISYGFSPNADFQAREARFFKNRSVFECWHRGSLLGEVKLNVPGRHNIANALATLAVGVLLELPFKDMVSALACFRGVQRRFHVKGSINDITVIDDYAHHPSEIKATLQAAREGWEHRLVVAFQPHRYSRTKLLCNDFGQAFSDADVVIVTDIYPAGEAPIDGISARNVADLVSRYNPGKDIRYLPSQVDVLNALEEMVEPGDMVFTMGAGDIWLLGEELVKYLKTHTGEEEVLAVVR